MFSLSLVSLWLATISAFVRPTTRTGGLEISLSTPAHQVASISELRIVATVRNVGDEDLKILKPGTVLDNRRPTLSFIVTKDGKEVPFTGVKVRAYSLPYTLHSPSPSLPPPFPLRCSLIGIHDYDSRRIRLP